MTGPTVEISNAGHLEKAGRLDEAEAVYREILRRNPDDIAALNLLGLLCHRRGRHADAATLIGRALAARPDDAEALCNLGAVQIALDDLPSAVSHFRRATTLAPHSISAWSNLGKALTDGGDAPGAVNAYRCATTLSPNVPQLWSLLAHAHYASGEHGLAADAYAQAAAVDPANAEHWCNLGAARHHEGDLAAAGVALRRATSLQPRHATAWRNLGAVDSDNGDDQAAIACFDRAIALEPQNAEVHVFRGISLLRSGRYKEGWAEYEWRLARRRTSADPGSDRPKWNGENFFGRRLLVHAEQGFGDTIQFMRGLPYARERGDQIQFAVQEPLRRLVAASPMMAGIEIVARGRDIRDADLQCPLLSLPGLFDADDANCLVDPPYLLAAPVLNKPLPPRRAPRRCALVWEGNLANIAGRNRAMPGRALDQLACLPDIEFVSMQIGAATRPEKLSFFDAAPLLEDFACTAAALSSVDLVISVDTAVAHLAGAMGKPCWVLLSYAADWRWLKDREDSPWYPSLRLFRQPCPGDWESVMRRVAERLAGHD